MFRAVCWLWLVGLLTGHALVLVKESSTIFQVRDWFPCVFAVSVVFPFDEVLRVVVPRIEYAFYFVFWFMVFQRGVLV